MQVSDLPSWSTKKSYPSVCTRYHHSVTIDDSSLLEQGLKQRSPSLPAQTSFSQCFPYTLSDSECLSHACMLRDESNELERSFCKFSWTRPFRDACYLYYLRLVDDQAWELTSLESLSCGRSLKHWTAANSWFASNFRVVHSLAVCRTIVPTDWYAWVSFWSLLALQP